MIIAKLTHDEKDEIIGYLTGQHYEMLIAYDPVDEAFKVKVDGHSWSRPLGVLDERYK